MALPAALAQWAKDAGEAFAAYEDAEGLLASLGAKLRTLFSSVEDMQAQSLYDPAREAFKEAYLATGKKEANVSANWASILYQYAWPGSGKVRGRYYKADEDTGLPVLDRVRNLPTPPPSASPAPKYLRSMPFISPEEVAEMGGWPLRVILAAGSGGGKTVYTRALLEALLPKLDHVVIVTGTLTEHWAGLPEMVEVLEFDEDPELERVKELIDTQKEIVRKKETPGALLFLFDDIGDRGGAKRGKVGELLDSMYMTLRNFGISVIAISQQQNNFLTPARRDGATVILAGDLSNQQREQIYDTLSIPPTQLPKKEFVTWCHETLGRAHNYTFLVFLKEQKKRQLYLTRAGDGEAVEDLGERLEELSLGGGGGAAYAPREVAAAGGGGGGGGGSGGEKQWGVFKQGGSQQKSARDLYTTHDYTIAPLLPVLEARVNEGEPMRIWEPCYGLGNIASVLEGAGYEVVGTDLYTADGKLQPGQSFIEGEAEGVALQECAVPKGVTHIVTNPPFSEKLAFIKRFYALGLPTYCLLPIDLLGTKGCVKEIEAHGGVEIFFLSGNAAKTFFNVNEGRDFSVGVCAWFGFNTRVEGEENYHHFL